MATVKPILRIFDNALALSFYCDWLGFTVDWKHQVNNGPVYLQVSRNDIVLHLSEHHGDCSPGARIFIDDMENLALYHQSLLEKEYRYNRPGIHIPFYDAQALEMTVIDPFSNRITFVQRGTT
jgi:catechol 2,3-dioxygenase-like lactoylglutathione lyase family enzyme